MSEAIPRVPVEAYPLLRAPRADGTTYPEYETLEPATGTFPKEPAPRDEAFALEPWEATKPYQRNLDAWTRECEVRTWPFREERANELTRKSRARAEAWARLVETTIAQEKKRAELYACTPSAWQLSHAGHPTLSAPLPSKASGHGVWHRQRARGYRERFERVAHCQQLEVLEARCGHCGHHTASGVRCRSLFVCNSCRGKISNEKRVKLARNRRCALNLIYQRGLCRWNRKGGRWSEKLLTLTLPHVPELGVTGRIKLLHAAWRPFAKSFNAYLKHHPDASAHVDRQGRSLARWFRNIEWTSGHLARCQLSIFRKERSKYIRDCKARGVVPAKEPAEPPCNCPGDPGGHPHVHLWVVGPYLPGAKAEDDPMVNVLRNLWRDALRQAAWKRNKQGELLFPELVMMVEGTEPVQGDLFAPKPAGVVKLKIGPERMARLGKKSKVSRLPPQYWREEITGLDNLVVDVRACRPGEQSLQEVIKYLFKSVIGGGRKVEPKIWAQVYEGYDGVRTTQGSRGLMSLEERERLLRGYLINDATGEIREVKIEDLADLKAPATGRPCGHCGTRGQWRISRRPMREEERQALAARRPLCKAGGGRRQQEAFFGAVQIA